MKLIDAEYLEKLISESYEMTELDGVRAGYSIVRVLIDKCPIIKPARKKSFGYWIQNDDPAYMGGGYVWCSHCGYGYSYGGYQCAEEEFLYCPHCGAEMVNAEE